MKYKYYKTLSGKKTLLFESDGPISFNVGLPDFISITPEVGEGPDSKGDHTYVKNGIILMKCSSKIIIYKDPPIEGIIHKNRSEKGRHNGNN